MVPILGEHVFYYRAGAIYSHHGISCGDGTIVHYESSLWTKCAGFVRPDWQPRITRVTIDEFACGASLAMRRYDRCDAAELAVERALSRLGECEYDLFENNCEHFAVWCKTGWPVSTQVTAHYQAQQALLRGSPLGLALVRSSRWMPAPYRAMALTGALALAGGVYTSHYLAARIRDRSNGRS